VKTALENPGSPRRGGVVLSVAPRSLAAEMGLQPGDVVVAVNGHAVEDVIDVQYYAADDEVQITYRRDSRRRLARAPRQFNQPLGLDFAHPTFDIDIRRCRNLCPFCFVLQMAPHMRRTLYIKDDDFRYSFLYGHFVTLTNLSRRDWRRIEQQHLSPLYISVHATLPKIRRQCLGLHSAPDILKQLRWLRDRQIEMHTQIVVTPGLNDGAALDRSVRDLAGFYPAIQSVSVVPVGLTKHHRYGRRLNTPEESARVLAAVRGWQAEFQRKLGVRFVYPTDEWFLSLGRRVPPKAYYDGLELEENGLGQARGFLDHWRRLKKELADRPAHRRLRRRATLVTGRLFETTLRPAADEFNALTGARLTVRGVENERLGSGVTVAGLLMGRDIVAQLKGQDLGELVILPRIMFDHPCGLSLDDVTPLDVAQDLGRPVFLAETMRDVQEALTGDNALQFDPASQAIPPEVMRAGGWAVEKYLG